jgi:glutathione synthase/RimK-type ligase-like ATP-grasp enzyme
MDDLNQPHAIRLAANKLESFKRFFDFNIITPMWTEKKDEAMDWVQGGATQVLCRTVLNGHSGRGIIVCSNPGELVDAPLYVKYKKKKAEFRVHVFAGKVIDVQQKKRRDGFREDENFNQLIRNHGNGWVYCRENLQYTPDLEVEAVKAVGCLGLDFGAVDMIYNQHENRYYVLEVNTAPGIHGQTLDLYVQAIVNRI